MYNEPPKHPALAAGDRVTVHGADETFVAGSVLRQARLVVELSLQGPRPEGPEFRVRHVTVDGEAWEIAGRPSLEGEEDCDLAVQLAGEWLPVSARAAARISATASMQAVSEASGVFPPGKRLDLVVTDVSSTGCAAGGVGRAPEIGDLFKVDCCSDGAQWVLARVVRVTWSPFGRWQAGLQFEATTADEREFLLAWRDGWAFEDRVA